MKGIQLYMIAVFLVTGLCAELTLTEEEIPEEHCSESGSCSIQTSEDELIVSETNEIEISDDSDESDNEKIEVDVPNEVPIKNSTENATDTVNSTVIVTCKPRSESDPKAVEIVNATGLLTLLESEVNVTSRKTPGKCLAVMFYSSSCQFSCLAAPHFNALPRAYPDVQVVAIDTMKHYSLNTQFGIVGVPTILLFHNGRPAARYNGSDYSLKLFSIFISKYTGLEPNGLLNVTSADFAGPVSTVAEKDTDHWLILSWLFIIVCAIYFLIQSALWRSMVDNLKNIWQEAHEHND